MRSTYNYINPEDRQKIQQAINTITLRKWSPQQIQWLFRICYQLGLRMSEARKLKYEDFDFDRRTVYLGKTKTKENESRQIPYAFIPELELHCHGKTGYIMNKIPHRKTVELWIKKLGNSIDVPAWTMPRNESHEQTKAHIFRKTLGKDMFFGTPEIKPKAIMLISMQLGHVSNKGIPNIQSTMSYLKLTEQVLMDAWENDVND